MTKILDLKTLNDVENVLKNTKNAVKIMFFHNKKSFSSQETKALLETIAPLSVVVELEVIPYHKRNKTVKKYNVKKAPAYLVLNKDGNASGIFYGVPAGHEINTLLTTIVDQSGYNELFKANILNEINKIGKEINIKVFVTRECPHCHEAAINALRLMQVNPLIKTEVYELHSNINLVKKYEIDEVPKIVFNDKLYLVGNHPIKDFIDTINS